MRNIVIFLVFLGISGTLTSCQGTDAKWSEAQSAAVTWWNHMRAKEYKEAWEMWQSSTKPAREGYETWLSGEKLLLEEYPDLYNVTVDVSPNKKASTRAGIYEFKVKVRWQGENPLTVIEKRIAGARTNADEYIMSRYSEDMYMAMEKQGGKWRVLFIKTQANRMTPQGEPK